MKLEIRALGPKSEVLDVELEFWGQGSKAGVAFLTSRDGQGKAIDRVLLQVNAKGQISIGKKREDL